MNVLSLFDGMSSAQLALAKIGIFPRNYYSSEVDKFAIKVTQANFPNTIQLGDVRALWGSHLEDIDLLIGGSPCQGFSYAGKGLNFDDPRSKLFFEFVRCIRDVKPKYYLLENVHMKQKWQDVISRCLEREPIAINSSLVSAQNRKRLYWTNIPNVSIPKDKGLVLQDILEDSYMTDREKSYCIDANYFKGGNLKSYFEKHRRQLVFSKDGLAHVADADLKGHDAIKRVYHPAGKAPTLTTMQGGHREPKVLCGSQRGRHLVEGVRKDYGGKTRQYIELRSDQKTNCISTVQKDNVAVYDAPDREPPRFLPSELSWRKLTVKECERLQTVPDGYTSCVSNTQAYKMLGNGFTVDVISHILGHAFKEDSLDSEVSHG